MVRISWSNVAIEDLKAIRDYISHDSPKYAILQIRKIKERVQILRTNPNAGKANPESQNESIRELIEGNYRIIYELVSQAEINILLVHHGARALEKRMQK